MRTLMRGLVAAVLAGSALRAQSAVELLKRAAHVYNDSAGFEVKGYATAKVPGTSWQVTYDVDTEASQPQSIPSGHRTGLMQAVTSVGNFHPVRVDNAAQDPFPARGFGMPGFGQYQTELTRRLLNAQQIGFENIRYDGQDRRCEIVDAEFDQSREFKPNSRSIHRRIYIDPETLWVLKEVQPADDLGEWTFVVTSLTFKTSLPRSSFNNYRALPISRKPRGAGRAVTCRG